MACPPPPRSSRSPLRVQERRETKEEREKRHAVKAAAIEEHRSKVKVHLSRQNANQKLRGKTTFHCPLKFDNTYVWLAQRCCREEGETLFVMLSQCCRWFGGPSRVHKAVVAGLCRGVADDVGGLNFTGCTRCRGRSLPEVPVEPKLLHFPFDTEQLYEYNTRRCPTLEETYAYGLHTEIDVGVPINLVDPTVYDVPKSQTPLHEYDRIITNPQLGNAVSLKKLPST